MHLHSVLGKTVRVLAFGGLLGPLIAAHGQDHPEKTTRPVAAQAFLATLDPDELEAVSRNFADPSRHGWSFFPARREALRLGDLDEVERAALEDFLRTALSKDGIAKLEEVLLVEPVSDRGGGVVTGPEEYHITFFGPPSKSEPWAWRFEGHHVALNQTLAGGRVIAATPSFLGSSPLRDDDGVEPLRREVQAARRVVDMLDADARERVTIDQVPGEIVSGMAVSWQLPEAEGSSLSQLPGVARKALRELAAEHVSIHADDVSQSFLGRWDRIDPEKIHFAWFGAVPGSGGHGYRLQGPEWVMEYVNVQARANHVHTVWRTLDGEFVPVAKR